jgi:hypothetical protein
MNGKHPKGIGRNGFSLLAQAACEPDDGIGAYTREQLMQMDARFAERLEHAFATGGERRVVETTRAGFSPAQPTSGRIDHRAESRPKVLKNFR